MFLHAMLLCRKKNVSLINDEAANEVMHSLVLLELRRASRHDVALAILIFPIRVRVLVKKYISGASLHRQNTTSGTRSWTPPVATTSATPKPGTATTLRDSSACCSRTAAFRSSPTPWTQTRASSLRCPISDGARAMEEGPTLYLLSDDGGCHAGEAVHDL